MIRVLIVEDEKPISNLIRMSEHHVDPGQQLDGVEGLDDVILRPQPQTLHPVVHGALGGEEDHRDLHGAYVLHQLKPVHLRKHHVQKDQVVGVLLQQIRRRRAIMDNVQDMKAYLEENLREKENAPDVPETGMAVLRQQYILAETMEAWLEGRMYSISSNPSTSGSITSRRIRS